jgi:hypothetical protein
MHSALWKLLWFDFRGGLRGLLVIRQSWRKLVLAILMLIFIGMFVATQWFGYNQTDARAIGAGGRFGSAMPFWSAIYLIVTWLTASSDRGLVMRPAEIHFLVAGPFPTSDIITLNLIRLAYRSGISALVLAAVSLAYVNNFTASLVGLWLLILVSLLVGMVVALSVRKVHGQWIHNTRRIVTVGCLVALLTMISQSMDIIRQAELPVTVPHIAAAAMETQVGKWILPPFAWMFAPLIAPALWPDVVMMLPPRLFIIAGLVAAIYALGADYQEASTARTDLAMARRQSSLRSGLAGGGSAWTRRMTLPAFGRWAGIGPIAWMQMVHSIRVLPRFVAFTIGVVGIIIVVPMMVESRQLDGWGGVIWMIGLNAYADFLLLLQLPVGFLGPASQRAMLKSLPIPVPAIVIGQLAGPLIPLAMMHAMVLGLFVYLLQDRSMVFHAALAMLPVALVLIANINLLAAWNIIKPRALQQRDALAAGRAMASVWIFFLTLLPAALLGTLGVVAFGWLSGPGIRSNLLGGAAGVMLSSLLYVGMLTYTFSKWQPTPAEFGAEEKEHDR